MFGRGELGTEVEIRRSVSPTRLEVSSPFHLIGILGTRSGNRRHTAARGETTSCWLASRRVFDLQQRCRSRSVV